MENTKKYLKKNARKQNRLHTVGEEDIGEATEMQVESSQPPVQRVDLCSQSSCLSL